MCATLIAAAAAAERICGDGAAAVVLRMRIDELSVSLLLLPASKMDHSALFPALEKVCEDNISILCGPSEMPYGTVTKRLVTCLKKIQEHGRALEPLVSSFAAVYHHYDLDAQTPGNGYRSLVKVRHAGGQPVSVQVSSTDHIHVTIKPQSVVGQKRPLWSVFYLNFIYNQEHF